ncbi:hypothetical protein GCM10010464_55330 [Pseudonocardia yunnanensis]|uniref:SPW repeat-containing protein n=1 Tax=Pseudonocardia yunnanensis TaxID=58107 RepID=A0ABW4F715_9PSEU
MSDHPPLSGGGRKVVAVVWAATGAVHLLLALEGAAGPAANAVSWVLAAAALAGVVALLLSPRREIMLAAAIAGAIGVASFLVPLIGPLVGFGGAPGNGVGLWSFAGFVLDALTVRLAAFTLRRAARTGG